MHLERTRVVEAVHHLDSLWKAQQTYYYENTAYTSTLADLDIDIPASGLFGTPTVATSDPIASVIRAGNAYTLRISPARVISCVGPGTICTNVDY